MTTLEKMERYISRTKMKNFIHYELCYDEMDVLYTLVMRSAWDGIRLAYIFGASKGYRAAKAEGKR